MTVRIALAVSVALLVASTTPAAEPAAVATGPTRAERVAIESCLAMMPPQVQVAIALSNVMNLGDHGEAVRALGRALLRLLESAAAKQH